MRNLAQINGSLLDTLTWDSYGNLLSETNPSNGDRFGFAGMEDSSIGGPSHQGARYYSSGNGTWSSEDPIGFGARDPNLRRYVRNSPTAFTDPTGLDSKEEWQKKAAAKIYVDKAKDWMDKAIQQNKKITAAYAELYKSDPKKFNWAGLAAFISAQVGKTLERLMYGQKSAEFQAMFSALAAVNQQVYLDVYWQLLAFQKGMAEIEALKKQNQISDLMYAAFKEIQAGNIEAGIRMLTDYEQRYSVQKALEKADVMMPGVLDLLKRYAMFPGQECGVPDVPPFDTGDFTNYKDRWAWIMATRASP